MSFLYEMAACFDSYWGQHKGKKIQGPLLAHDESKPVIIL